MGETPFFEIQGANKRYGGVTALNNVNFSCERRSIHAIVGENGAGKSTLIKIISGVVQPDSGRMMLQGHEVSFTSPSDAANNGIVCVFQEVSLIPDLSVADNICLMNPPRKWGFIHQRAQRTRAKKLLERVGCGDINPRERCASLPLSRCQMVEIAKALGRDAKLLILDEATSALSGADVEEIFQILKDLRNAGLCILYITHRIHEIEKLADICSVFRNGEHIETFDQRSKTSDEIVRMMIGRSISKGYPAKPTGKKQTSPVFEVERLSWEDRLHDISFSIGEGEIVGLGGLDGQGQRELLLALFGVLRGLSGTMKRNGRKVAVRSPSQAKNPRNSIAMIPEDRKTEGLLLPISIRDNISLASLKRLSKASVVDRKKEEGQIYEVIRQLQIKVDSIDDPAASLSGGNQQKVVVAKWLLTGAQCLLLMDPTRGIDVGTKQEIYRLFRQLADQGTSILFYSTDFEELIGMCDRVIIFYEGKIVRELQGEEITERNIIAASLNLPMDETTQFQEATAE